MPDLTTGLIATLFPAVSFSRRLFCLVLATVWLAATQLCAWEAAGFSADHASAEDAVGCCTSGVTGCEEDGCEAIDDGQFRSDVAVVSVDAPVLAVIAWLGTDELIVRTDPTPTWAGTDRERTAPSWVPAWAFVRRASALAQAPSGQLV